MSLSLRNSSIISIVLSCIFQCSGFLNALDIVRDGQATSLIVVDSKAEDSVLFAAKELQKYIQKTSGAEIPIKNIPSPDDKNKTIIYLGKNIDGMKELSADGFRIFAKDKSLFISGKDSIAVFGAPHPMRKSESYSEELKLSRYGETGTLFGVYHFLEKYCGTRWYMPGELGEVVPRCSTITVPDDLSIAINLDFEYRFLYNCDFPKDKDGALWNRRAGYGASCPVPINHSFHYLNKFAKDHPEYFALIDGDKRDINISSSLGNLCLSNPEVADRFVELIDDYFNKNPGQYIFPVMPNDVIRVCECPACQAQINLKAPAGGKHSDYVWNFVDKVAKRIYILHPDKFIGCACYGEYLLPPSRKLSPNIVIQFCAACRNFSDPKTKKHYTDLMNQWETTVEKKNIYYWDYYNWLYGGGSLLKNVPVAFPHIISDNLKFLKGKIKGEFIEAENWDSDNKEKKIYYPALTHLNWYITAKLLWNADANVDNLLDDYYKNFYGPAQKEMKEFWTFAEILWMKKTPETENDLYNTVYTEYNVSKLFSILEQAKARSADPSPERQRIELLISEMNPLKERVTNLRVINKASYICKHTSNAPVFNSESNEKCWENSPLIDFVTQDGTPLHHKTQMAISYDNDNLYLLFINHGDTSKLKTCAKEKDSIVKPYIWDDDSIEIFINATPQYEKDYFQFIVNAKGTIWDGHSGTENLKNNAQRWDSHIQSSVTLTPSAWILKVKIPFRDLNLPTTLPNFITANFVRNCPTDNITRYGYWSPPLNGINHTLSRFGKIIFEDNQPPLQTEFSKAYEYFSKAKAGENNEWKNSYSNASAYFEKLAAQTRNQEERLTYMLLSAFCLFLNLDFEKADKASNLAYLLARQLYPADPSINTLTQPPDKNSVFSQNILSKLTMLSKIEEGNLRLYTHLKKLKPIGNFPISPPKVPEPSTIQKIAVLLAKLAPSQSEILEKLDQALCASRLKWIGMLLFLYAEDNDGKIPYTYQKEAGTWKNLLSRYEKKWIMNNSVLDENENPCRYGMNAYLTYKLKGNLVTIRNNPNMILIADSVHFRVGDYPSRPNYNGASYMLSPRFEHSGMGTVDRTRHQEGCNILFTDGHVEWLPAEKISSDPRNEQWQ